MELRQALKEQYRAGLKMLAQCVEKRPEGMWLEGGRPRAFWRVAFHAAIFTHLYLGRNEEAFQPRPERSEGIHQNLWQAPAEAKPYELPERAGAASPARDRFVRFERCFTYDLSAWDAI